MTKEISTDAELISRLLSTHPTPAECLVAAARIEQLRDRLARMEGALTPSGETKADYMGEFSFPDAITDEDGNEMTVRVTVPWTTIKEIMAAIHARAQDREPDYCYDDEWEYTMRWDEWPDLVDSHDLTEPMAVNTLYKGPTKWVVRVPLDTDGDGEADDWETKMFDSKDEARAALTDGGSNG
jgi:hypothetical protein